MATVDAELQQSNGLLVPLDENNNNNRNGSVVQPRDLLQDPNKLELVDNGLSPCYSSPNVSPVPPNTPAATTATTPTNSGESFPTIFKLFAKFGDSKSTGDNITLSNSDKWFKQAKIIDGKTITTTDTGIYFKQVAKTKRSLSLKEYNMFLDKLATVKKIEVNDIKEKLRASGPPATNKTTTAMTSGAIGRLTDHTKYTGSHRQRFDQSGKGLGKAGR